MAPGLARYCVLCCTHERFVLFSSQKTPSRRGVQEGDPLGPSKEPSPPSHTRPGHRLFSWMTAPSAAPKGATHAFHDGLLPCVADRGVVLNPATCEYTLTNPILPASSPAGALLWKIRHVSCFSLLGASFNRPEFCLRVQEKLERAQESLVSQLTRFQSVATALVLSRVCLWCQTSYHASTTLPDRFTSVPSTCNLQLCPARDYMLRSPSRKVVWASATTSSMRRPPRFFERHEHLFQHPLGSGQRLCRRGCGFGELPDLHPRPRCLAIAWPNR